MHDFCYYAGIVKEFKAMDRRSYHQLLVSKASLLKGYSLDRASKSPIKPVGKIFFVHTKTANFLIAVWYYFYRSKIYYLSLFGALMRIF